MEFLPETPALEEAPELRLEGEPEALLRADAALAKRCVAGEVAAWSELYHQCHELLLKAIRRMTANTGCGDEVAEEIAARIWYALVKDDGKLLSKYDVRCGARLITFMGLLAKSEINSYFRAEVRRRRREMVAAGGRNENNRHPDQWTGEEMSEFFDTLTPKELEFCEKYLMVGVDEQASSTYSSANVWQLTRRVYQKFVSFLG